MENNKHGLKQYEHPLHRVLRTFWGDDFDFVNEDLPALRRLERESNLSLSEDDKNVYVEAGMPGLNENEIEITLERGVLWIRGHKKEEQDNKKYHYRAKRSYSYQLALPESVDESKEPEAHYEKGVLKVTFAKTKSSPVKKISVKKS